MLYQRLASSDTNRSIFPFPAPSTLAVFLQEAERKTGSSAQTAVAILTPTHKSHQRKLKPCSEALTLSAIVVINCHHEVPQRFPVVLNTMCCQKGLTNIDIYTNPLHFEIKFQKELMLCVSEVGRRMQIKPVNVAWAVCSLHVSVLRMVWCRLAAEINDLKR